MKRDICTRCEKALHEDDRWNGARLKVMDRFREPRNMWTARRRIRAHHDLCATCASELAKFLRGWKLAPPKPPSTMAPPPPPPPSVDPALFGHRP